MSGGKWSTTDRVLKSCRRKMGIIYTCNHKNNDHPSYDHNLLVVTCGNLYIYIYIYIYVEHLSYGFENDPFWPWNRATEKTNCKNI